MTNGPDPGTVTFVQYDVPPLQAGEYTVLVEQAVNQAAPNSFSATARFAVTAPRLVLDPAQIHNVFPPPLANGEFSGVLPQVAFTSPTLPWQRSVAAGTVASPWLAVLLFDEDEAPKPLRTTAAGLVPAGERVSVDGSPVTGVGTLPPRYLSYPGINPLGYGETPDEECVVIDVPLAMFNRVAPAAEDLPFLAETREVDTVDSQDTNALRTAYALVTGNRIAAAGTCHAFLVSLENMGPLLPSAEGAQSPSMPPGTTTVRLLCLTDWTFMNNDLDETLQGLLEHLNKVDGVQGLSSLQVPFAGPRPSGSEVEQALARQASGSLTPDDARVLLRNALQMGYLPAEHYLRHAGQTVSWYRGPLAPYPIHQKIELPISTPDAANRYNPQTGMFDVSYGAAWQIGQLLALQDTAFSTALYTWKRTLHKNQVVAAEQELIEAARRSPTMLSSFFAWRAQRLARAAASNDPPAVVVSFLTQLMLLVGVPFQYLVPDESMLPPESMRFFQLDPNWMEALFDGAFSIGRATIGELHHDAGFRPLLRERVAATMRRPRRSRVVRATPPAPGGAVSGFLLRSQAVFGWPNLNAVGYADRAGDIEVPRLRMARLSDQVLFCLFDGVVQSVALHEPPEQLHYGVERLVDDLTTTLRAVTGPDPGKQFPVDPKGGPPVAVIPARADGQTLKISQGAANILAKLNDDFSQGITDFTSAEFALEMIKGVLRVLYAERAVSLDAR